jgi:hypothetical protein
VNESSNKDSKNGGDEKGLDCHLTGLTLYAGEVETAGVKWSVGLTYNLHSSSLDKILHVLCNVSFWKAHTHNQTNRQNKNSGLRFFCKSLTHTVDYYSSNAGE